MKFITTDPQKATKLLIKQHITRDEIEVFKTNLKALLDQINVIDARPKDESEEHLKNNIRDFLRDTYYKGRNEINTKGRNDLVIHLGPDTNANVGVIIEAKRPKNVPEMSTPDNPNKKALQELVWYFMNERHQNPELKRLVLTNILDWYIIDVNDFDKLIYNNSSIKKLHANAVQEKKSSTWFYDEVAKLLAAIDENLPCIHFNIRQYENVVRNEDKEDDKLLLALYKLLSPHYLLKEPIVNDSNTLDKRFYNELLHIIGLTESKEGSKKLIGRLEKSQRHSGTFIESAIAEIDSLDKLSRLDKPSQYGATIEERLYSVAMELTITWVNRILFLKLLEGQLIKYHKGDKSYAFLNTDSIKSFDDLNTLFFKVLAKPYNERLPEVKESYAKVPYLNSSLFEPTELEHSVLFVSNLRDDQQIPVYEKTILTEQHSVKRLHAKEKITTLEYLFRFLDAYDFGAEDVGGIRQENKTIINASVLGLIFEKINGYKDGSFFTPGFITMYMCRETIRKAVVQKFNDIYEWNCQTFNELQEDVSDFVKKAPEGRKDARKVLNQTFNQIRICDPAVGSGHFLVSALNEMLAVKSELAILTDKEGDLLTNYTMSVVNDELLVTNEHSGEIFEYNPGNKESQRIQETLFHEKQTIIENCLFGVDINPNSVKICRLRLWIELLKNAYYKGPDYKELETLPNIDINIKCGNSLVSRFPIDADIRETLKSKKDTWTIQSYKEHVKDYRRSKSKAEKQAAMAFLQMIKKDFKSEIDKPFKKKISEARGKVDYLSSEILNLSAFKQTVSDDLKEKHAKAAQALHKLESEREEILSNKIFENAFEWRFEFPEVLSDDGDFVGFDVVIGNPPYIPLEAFGMNERKFFNRKYAELERKYETSVPFILEGFKILDSNGLLAYIAPVTWQTGENYSKFRKYFFEQYGLLKLINLPFNIFEDAYVDTALYFVSKQPKSEYLIHAFDKKSKVESLENLHYSKFKLAEIKAPDYKVIIDKTAHQFSRFDSNNFVQFGTITKSTQGLSGSNFPQACNLESEFIFPFLSKGNVYNFSLIKEGVYYTDLADKKNLIQFYQAEPKILIRRIISRQDRLSVTFCDEKLVFKKDINPFIPIDDNFDCHFLTGVIASRLISFIYLNSSAIATKDDFRQTTLTELRKLPIPNVDFADQKPISDIVKEILTLKSERGDFYTADLENQIDQLVYQLYDLTEEEIQIVEDSFK